jgi:5-methyltetrahydropteroyltriglutamate--homocysteine methyltransferase
MAQQSQDDYYGDKAELALAYAAAVNEEAHDLKLSGADIIQIDEPYLQARPAEAVEYALPAINRAIEGIDGDTVLHMCFGYAHLVQDRPEAYSYLGELDDSDVKQISIETAQPHLDYGVLSELAHKHIVLGVVDLSEPGVETPEAIAARVREALRYAPADRLTIAPDCGMKYLARETAFKKLQAMVAGTQLVRADLS